MCSLPYLILRTCIMRPRMSGLKPTASLDATCALTENAFVRVLCNPAYPGRGTTVEDAVSRLRNFCSARRMYSGRIPSVW